MRYSTAEGASGEPRLPRSHPTTHLMKYHYLRPLLAAMGVKVRKRPAWRQSQSGSRKMG